MQLQAPLEEGWREALGADAGAKALGLGWPSRRYWRPPKQLKQEKRPRRVPAGRLLAAAWVPLLTGGTPRLGGGLSNGGPDPSSHRHIRSAAGSTAVGKVRAPLKTQDTTACLPACACTAARRPGSAGGQALAGCRAAPEDSGRELYWSSLLRYATFSSVSELRYLTRTGPSTELPPLGPASPPPPVSLPRALQAGEKGSRGAREAW
jgi:hypothetical protein